MVISEKVILPELKMKRKLVKQGTATLMVSLPSKWVKRHGLGKGSEIDVIEDDSQLIIGAKSVARKKEAEIVLKRETLNDIKNILTHYYRRGFDKLKIKEIDAKKLTEVRNITQKSLLGFEITQIKEEYCIIENISEPNEEKYQTILRRIFLLIKELQENIKTDFEKKQFTKIEQVTELRDQQDKFILFLRRYISKYKNRLEFPMLEWELLTFLMHISHAYYYLYKFAYDNKLVDKNTIELFNASIDYFELFYDAYYTKEITKVHEINKLRKNYQYGKCYEYLQNSKGKESVLYSHLREIFRLIQVGTSPILSMITEHQ